MMLQQPGKLAHHPGRQRGSRKSKYLGDWLMDNGKMAAYGLTEPGAGSDVAGIKTTAIAERRLHSPTAARRGSPMRRCRP